MIVDDTVPALGRLPTDAPQIYSSGFHLRQNLSPCRGIVKIESSQAHAIGAFNRIITGFRH